MATAAGNRWRRITVRIVVLLLLGAVVNVAVAALCICVMDPEVLSKRELPTNEIRVGSLVGDAVLLPNEHLTELRSVGFGTDFRSYTACQFRLGRMVAEHRFVGWPAHSFEGWCESRDRSGTCTYHDAIPGPRIVPEAEIRDGFYPMGIVWNGVLLSTLFYAAVLWLLFFAPFAARRTIRRRRGRCPQCGYDLRGELAEGCSECGWNKHPLPLGEGRGEGRRS